MKILRPFSGMALLGCLFLFFLIVISVVSPFVVSKASNPVAAVRILTVMQDIFVFIVPALVAAMLSTRLPATMLRLDRRPPLKTLVLALLVLAAAVPAMNLVVDLNKSISFGGLDARLRAMEVAAGEVVSVMTGGTSVGALVVSLLIVGVLAGLSEEIFFRGALQRLMGQTSLGTHGAIWTTALLFSAVHIQFYGFVPRLLLGAYFGYLAVWSGSLWVPILAHAFNNSIATVAMWLTARGSEIGAAADTFGSDLASPTQLVAVVISVGAVAIGLKLLASSSVHAKE